MSDTPRIRGRCMYFTFLPFITQLLGRRCSSALSWECHDSKDREWVLGRTYVPNDFLVTRWTYSEANDPLCKCKVRKFNLIAPIQFCRQ